MADIQVSCPEVYSDVYENLKCEISQMWVSAEEFSEADGFAKISSFMRLDDNPFHSCKIQNVTSSRTKDQKPSYNQS